MQRDLDALSASSGPRIYLRHVIQHGIQVNNKHDWIQHFSTVVARSHLALAFLYTGSKHSSAERRPLEFTQDARP